MKKYTIGALFMPGFDKILLIEKVKPDWQKGKLNFPGGHIEDVEAGCQCIAREFREETGLIIPVGEWKYIGKILNSDSYFVDFFTAIYYPSKHGEASSLTIENIKWVECNNLPENIISNLRWLIPFAINIHNQGNSDNLIFGNFQYAY